MCKCLKDLAIKGKNRRNRLNGYHNEPPLSGFGSGSLERLGSDGDSLDTE